MDPELLVMSSIRRPKRIRFFGSDGRERMFLVKGGEDLRNDERIELLFEVMNSIVASSSASSSSSFSSSASSLSNKNTNNNDNRHCSVRSNLRARTYAVIPMTSKVGILEWVNNTIPIKSIIAEEMLDDKLFKFNNPSFTKETDILQIESVKIRNNWLKDNSTPTYHQMFKNATKKNIYDLYDKMNKLLPNNFIRKKLLKICMGPESFLTLRTEFSKTLAISSLYGYILGLGDRHLENLLMDVRTGGILQIDFGVCFGMGQSVLPVPEFIPFRLSPQLVGVLQPLNGTGLLRYYMVQAMSLLRLEEGYNILSNYLQVTRYLFPFFMYFFFFTSNFYLFIYFYAIFIFLFFCFFIYFFFCPIVSLFIYLFLRLFFCFFNCPFDNFLTVCLFHCLFVGLFVCLFFSVFACFDFFIVL